MLLNFNSCVMKISIFISISLLLCSCQAKLPVNVPELADGNPTLVLWGQRELIRLFLISNVLFLSRVIKYIRPVKRQPTIRLSGIERIA